MNHPTILAAGLCLLLMFLLGGLWLMRDIRLEEAFAARVRTIHGQPAAARGPKDTVALRSAAASLVALLGRLIINSGLVPAKTRSELELMLAASGLRGPEGVGIFIGAKIVMLVALPLAAWLVTRDMALSRMMHLLIPPLAGIVGLLSPDWLISKRRKRYQERLEKGLPDALDMMVICAQAGLGLGAAIVRVAGELRTSYRELALEMALTANELQIMTDSRLALLGLGTRTGVEGFKRLATTLIQTVQYGTPLTDALRTLSAEMRQEALTKFEEKAARLPVMLTMPMIAFVLPSVFLIAGGPSILQVSRTFAN